MTQVETPPAKYPTISDLPESVRGELYTFLLALTDTKQRLGFQTSHWVTGTPAIEGAVGAAAIAQDELGHARTLYTLLRGFPEAPESLSDENDLKSTRERVHPSALDEKWDTWLKVIAINVTLDSALQEVFKALRQSSFGQLAAVANKITQEEKFHRVFGETWMERLVKLDPETAAHMQQQIDWAYPIAESWLGEQGDTLVNEGLLSEKPSDILPRWRADLKTKLDKAGLKLPAQRASFAGWDASKREIRA